MTLVYEMPEAEYHARPELSSTGARRILDSPARFKWEQDHRVETVAFDIGHAVHAKILGVGSPTIAYPDEHLTPSGNPSAKAATVAWLDEQRSAGLVPIAAADQARVDAMAEAVLANRLARAILEGAHREVSAFATDPDTGVNVRARFDILRDDIAADVKTAQNASPIGFGREAAKHGYPIQQAWYLDTLRWATGASDVPFRFIVVEKKPPHLVAVHHLPYEVEIAARDLAARARHTYAECVTARAWPGYGDDLLTTQIPTWWWGPIDDDLDDMVVI
jgi:hypothetical protein